MMMNATRQAGAIGEGIAAPGPIARRPEDAMDMESMRRAMAGDAEAYGQLFERSRERIYRLAYGFLHDAAGAEDCVQETFTKGLANLSSYRGESHPRGWFSSIAMNVCRRRLRDGKHQQEGASDRTLEGGRRFWRPQTRAPLSKVVLQEDFRLLALAMGYLTEPQREVFLLHYLQELSYDEIGGILGIRAGAARALSHRAKAMLRDKLGSEVWVSKHIQEEPEPSGEGSPLGTITREQAAAGPNVDRRSPGSPTEPT